MPLGQQAMHDDRKGEKQHRKKISEGEWREEQQQQDQEREFKRVALVRPSLTSRHYRDINQTEQQSCADNHTVYRAKTQVGDVGIERLMRAVLIVRIDVSQHSIR